MNLLQAPIGDAAGMLLCIMLLENAAQEPDLIQPGAVMHFDGKTARADLGEERALITFLDRVEALLVIGSSW